MEAFVALQPSHAEGPWSCDHAQCDNDAMQRLQAETHVSDVVVRIFLPLAALILALSVGASMAAASHWPLVGDEGLIHYVVFLMRTGRRPYSEIIDVNWPGSYLIDDVYMRLLGSGPAGLRLYDAVLCCMACTGLVALGRPGWKGRVVGLIGGLLFTLVHLRDGVVQAGQRDLMMAVLVLFACVAMVRGPFKERLTGVLIFQFLAGCTLIIKPTLLPIVLVPIFLFKRRGATWGTALYKGSLSILVALTPVALMCVWLLDKDVFASFISLLRTTELVHNGLSRQSMAALFGHLVAPLFIVFLGAIVTWITNPARRDAELQLLLVAACAGIFSFMIQGKGFPYHRYPCLLLALAVSCHIFAKGLERLNRKSIVPAATLCYVCFGLGPVYASHVRAYDSDAAFQSALGNDLRLAGAAQSNTQCLDTVGGCIDTLYNMRLVQATGYIYDCYAYAGTTAEKSAYRDRFMQALERSRPAILVLTSRTCLTYADDLQRVVQWPALDHLLTERYERRFTWSPSTRVRWWNEIELPPRYTIFTKK
jgi:hypothetical protein